MAIDNTPPRLKLIVTIAVITVVTLVSLDFVFKSYYAMMTDEAQREKVAPTRDRDDQTKAEAVALTGAQVPVEQAMSQLAKGDRPAAITPNPSEDMGPMTGWSKLPKPAPTPHAETTMIAPGVGQVDGGGADLLLGDGGHGPGPAMAAGDAGAPAVPSPANADAGAKPMKPLGRPHPDSATAPLPPAPPPPPPPAPAPAPAPTGAP